MKFDFHTHGKLSRTLDFSLSYFEHMVKNAYTIGLDAIALTEHYETKDFFTVYEQIQEAFPYENGYFLVHGLKVFPGIEVDTLEKGHILCIGDLENIFKLRNQLQYTIDLNIKITLEQLFTLIQKLDFLVIGAHPFREDAPLAYAKQHILKMLDALELNANDLYNRGTKESKKEVEALAMPLDIPIIGSSGSCHFMQYGSVYTELEKDCATIDEIKLCLHNKAFEVKIAHNINEKVACAIELKKVEKEKLFANQSFIKRADIS